MSFDRNLLSIPRQFFSTLNIVRVPLAVAVLASLALYVPPQTHEIYRILVQDLKTDWPQILASYVSLFLACWILWTTADYLTQRHAGTSAQSKLRSWLPCLIGAARIVACGLGMIYAQQGLIHVAVHAENVLAGLGGDIRIEELKTLKADLETNSEILQIGAFICFGLAALLILWARLRARGIRAEHPAPL